MKLKKRIKMLLLCSLALLVMVGCTAWDPTLSKEEGDLKEASQEEFTLDVVDKTLPQKYRNYKRFVDFDGKYYYFCDDGGNGANEYIAMAKKSNHIIYFGGLPKENIVKLQYGHDNKLYLGAIKTVEGSDMVHYAIYELTKGDEPQKKIFEKKLLGAPDVMSAGDNLIMTLNYEKTTDLALLNLKTGEYKKIATYRNFADEEGDSTGQVITGLDWTYSIARPDGFLYCVSQLDDQKIDEGVVAKNLLYYYNFESGQVEEVSQLDHQPSFVGGAKDLFVTMDLQTGPERPLAKLHNKHFSDYRYMRFPRDDNGEEMMGCGFIDKYSLVAYYPSSYYLINTLDKTYEKKTFRDGAKLSKEDIERMPAQNRFATRSFYNGRFLYSYILGDTVRIVEVKLKDK